MNQNTTKQTKGNQKINKRGNLNRLKNRFNYRKAILLAMSLLLIVNCSDDDKSSSSNTPDTTAPTVSSVTSESTTSITLIISENVFGTEITLTDFTISDVSTPTAVSSVNVSDNTITLMLSAAIVVADIPKISYMPTPTSNTISDAAGNALAEFSNQTITYDPGTRDPATGYQPTNTERPPTGGWVKALAAIRALMEYHKTREPDLNADPVEFSAADQIGAAYAHARGYTGEGVIVSNVGRRAIDRDHADLSTTGKLIDGYGADGDDSTTNAGTCSGATACGDDTLGTHITAIIAGESGNGGVQGIAYNAQIKPINIDINLDDFKAAKAAESLAQQDFNDKFSKGENTVAALAALRVAQTATTAASDTYHAKRTLAIQEASVVDKVACGVLKAADMTDNTMTAVGAAVCKPVAVMNNDWHAEVTVTYSESSNTYSHVSTQNFIIDPLDTRERKISTAEQMAWNNATANTVLVFAAGDNGRNSVNGMVKLYMDDSLTTRAMEGGAPKEVAWADIYETLNPGTPTVNVAGSYNTLLELAGFETLTGKILSVIALDENNIIHKYSNGCGSSTQDWCLGAPGVAINSAIPGTGSTAYSVESGTGQAAAHVSAAVAILKGAFLSLTPTQLVNKILDTADYIRIDSDPVGKTDGTNRVYGHGKLNLARATAPDSTVPTLSSASATSDTSITLFMSESVYGADITSANFTVTGVTPAPTVNAVSDVSGRTITLTLSGTAIASSHTDLKISYTYTMPGTSPITDAAGLPLAPFDLQTITNNVQ